MKKITRRDLLKAIIAGSGGIVAAGFLPEKWLKPVVKSGVLPVHAQASAPTPIPELFIRGGFFIYREGSTVDEYVQEPIAFALVSYKEITDFGFADSPPINFNNRFEDYYPKLDSPAKDIDVSLFIDGVKEEPTKKTNENGLVEWSIEYTNWQFVFPTSIDATEGAELIFKLDNGKESVVTVQPEFVDK